MKPITSNKRLTDKNQHIENTTRTIEVNTRLNKFFDTLYDDSNKVDKVYIPIINNLENTLSSTLRNFILKHQSSLIGDSTFFSFLNILYNNPPKFQHIQTSFTLKSDIELAERADELISKVFNRVYDSETIFKFLPIILFGLFQVSLDGSRKLSHNDVALYLIEKLSQLNSEELESHIRKATKEGLNAIIKKVKSPSSMGIRITFTLKDGFEEVELYKSDYSGYEGLTINVYNRSDNHTVIIDFAPVEHNGDLCIVLSRDSILERINNYKKFVFDITNESNVKAIDDFIKRNRLRMSPFNEVNNIEQYLVSFYKVFLNKFIFS